jgi:23S rRNA (uridine2552-2'-O)-methyltransferase
MGKKASKGEWLRRQNKDQYVLTSRREGLRSRAAFKLEQINKKYKILNSGYRVLDLGCAPGGWLSVARKYVGPNGKVVGVDLLDMDPIDGIDFIKGDFRDQKIVEQIQERTEIQGLDLVISDMAPNITGVRETDQANLFELLELVQKFALENLKPGGNLLFKCFEGSGVKTLRSSLKGQFKRVTNFKPAASRKESREFYILGQHSIIRKHAPTLVKNSY